MSGWGLFAKENRAELLEANNLTGASLPTQVRGLSCSYRNPDLAVPLKPSSGCLSVCMCVCGFLRGRLVASPSTGTPSQRNAKTSGVSEQTNKTNAQENESNKANAKRRQAAAALRDKRPPAPNHNNPTLRPSSPSLCRAPPTPAAAGVPFRPSQKSGGSGLGLREQKNLRRKELLQGEALLRFRSSPETFGGAGEKRDSAAGRRCVPRILSLGRGGQR